MNSDQNPIDWTHPISSSPMTGSFSVKIWALQHYLCDVKGMGFTFSHRQNSLRFSWPKKFIFQLKWEAHKIHRLSIDQKLTALLVQLNTCMSPHKRPLEWKTSDQLISRYQLNAEKVKLRPVIINVCVRFLGQLQLSSPCTITFRKVYTLYALNTFEKVPRWRSSGTLVNKLQMVHKPMVFLLFKMLYIFIPVQIRSKLCLSPLKFTCWI